MRQPWFQHDASPVHLGIGVSIHHPAVFSPVPAPALGEHLWAQSEENPPPGPLPQPHGKGTFSTVLRCRCFGKAPVRAQPRCRCQQAPETGACWTRIAPERGTAAKKPTPRISSHPLRSEASWHGPSRGERREFLLLQNDLTFPP